MLLNMSADDCDSDDDVSTNTGKYSLSADDYEINEKFEMVRKATVSVSTNGQLTVPPLSLL